MPESVRRGYHETDERDFIDQIEKLREAGSDLYYLINHGYPIKSASTFIGNHFLLSERQRLALVRSISPKEQIKLRKEKELTCLPEGCEVFVDGFNTVITLENAFSNSTLLSCMDGTIRDLAGLRGTYRLTDKTRMAATTIRKVLEAEKISKAHFLLDEPVSNSGRLKEEILTVFTGSDVYVECDVIRDVDRCLYDKENVITADAIILDHCVSWFNLVRRAIEKEMGGYPYIVINQSGDDLL